MSTSSSKWVEEYWDPLSGPSSQPGSVSLDVNVLIRPAKRKAQRVFLAGLENDLFQASMSDDDISKVCQAMDLPCWQTFLVVTSNPRRLASLIQTNRAIKQAASMHHIWWGVRVEEKAHLPRIGDLRAAAVQRRFLLARPQEDLGTINLGKIDWVVAGRAPGPAHPSSWGWLRSIEDQCKAAEAPFSFLGWGSRTSRSLLGKTNGGFPELDRPDIPSKDVRDTVAGNIAMLL